MDEITYRTTRHGENIAYVIPGEDAFGASGKLNPADVFAIIDAIHSNLCNHESDDDDQDTVSSSLSRLLGEWMDSLHKQYNID